MAEAFGPCITAMRKMHASSASGFRLRASKVQASNWLGAGSWKLSLRGFAGLQHQNVDTERIDELLEPFRRAGEDGESAVVHGDDLANAEHSRRQRGAR